MADLDLIMFEVEDRTVTLRVEEWATIMTALELQQGFQALQPEPEVMGRVQKRIMRQLVEKRNDDA